MLKELQNGVCLERSILGALGRVVRAMIFETQIRKPDLMSVHQRTWVDSGPEPVSQLVLPDYDPGERLANVSASGCQPFVSLDTTCITYKPVQIREEAIGELFNVVATSCAQICDIFVHPS